MEDNFTLCQGVSVGGAEKLRSCCHIQGDNIVTSWRRSPAV